MKLLPLPGSPNTDRKTQKGRLKSTTIQQVGSYHRLVPGVMDRAWTLHESPLHWGVQEEQMVTLRLYHLAKSQRLPKK